MPVQEAAYFARTSQAEAVLAISSLSEKGNELADVISGSTKSSYFCMDISSALGLPTIPIGHMLISSDHVLDLMAPGLIIFTSGTTGPPKGAMKKRNLFTQTSEDFALWYHAKEDDVVLHPLPVHHATGISINFLVFIVAGASVEFQSSGFAPAAIWERWKQGGLTVFSGVPTMYQRMMQYFQDDISKRPPHEVQEYVTAARRFRLMVCGTSALPYPLQMKWQKLLDGKRILERYGATEFGGVFSAKIGDNNNPDVSTVCHDRARVLTSRKGLCGKSIPGYRSSSCEWR